jgi:hypothetical protein
MPSGESGLKQRNPANVTYLRAGLVIEKNWRVPYNGDYGNSWREFADSGRSRERDRTAVLD